MTGLARMGVAGVVALTCLAGAGAASAHLRSGTVAVDYRVSVSRPVTRAYSARIYQSDHGLSLTLHAGHVVVVLGYLGEPVIRLNRAGLSVNVASPTARAMHLVDKAHAAAGPGPRWRLDRGRRTVLWHDARVQGLPPGLTEGVWRVPLVVDGRGVVLSGDLRRFADPSLWLWVAALAGWLAVAAIPLVMSGRNTGGRNTGSGLPSRPRPDAVRSTAIALGVIASGAATVVAVAFALDAYASPGTWIVGADVIFFLAVGIGVMRRGPRPLHIAAAIWVGLVSLALGLLDGAVFFHPIVLAVLPGTVMRLLVVTAIGAGTGAAALGAARLGEITAGAAVGDRVPM